MPEEKNVDYVAKLARIEITKEEQVSLSAQLSKIIGYIDKLKEVNVEGVEPLRDVGAQKNIFREDKAKESGLKEDILNNAPSRQQDYFKIPKVIE